MKERDSMTCRACGQEERASEGYPCTRCGTFLCVVCNMRGIEHCRACAEALGEPPPSPPTPRPI